MGGMMAISCWGTKLARGLTSPSIRRVRAPSHRIIASFGASPVDNAPRLKSYELRGHGVGGATCVVSSGGNHTIKTDLPRKMGGKDEAPQPVELLVSALIGCEQATAAYIARHMKPRMMLRGCTFDYVALRDDRGATALPLDATPPAPARLMKVSGTATVHLDEGTESEERIEELKRLVEARCPVANTLASGGCHLDVHWVLAGPGAEFELAGRPHR